LNIGIIFSFPYLVPAIFNLKEIRQPLGTYLGDWAAFGNNFYQNRHTFIISLIFSIYLIIYLLSIRAVWQRRNKLEKFRQFKNETHQPQELTKKGSSGTV
jgi:hypothetical protein